MIYVLACRCHNSEPLARKIMRESNQENWQTQPIIKGRPECMTALNALPQNEVIQAIRNHIQRVSSWTIFIGTDGEEYRWSDVGKGKRTDRLDAELILEEFNV